MRRGAPITKPGQSRQERREAFAGEAGPHEKDQEVFGTDPEGEPPFLPPAPADLGREAPGVHAVVSHHDPLGRHRVVPENSVPAQGGVRDDVGTPVRPVSRPLQGQERQVERRRALQPRDQPPPLERENLPQVEAMAAATHSDHSGDEGSDLIVDDVEAVPPDDCRGPPAELHHLQPAGTGRASDGAEDSAGIPDSSDPRPDQVHLVTCREERIHQLPRAPLASALPVEIEGHHGDAKPVRHVRLFSAVKNR